jgi:hypothetical protein
MSKKAVRGVLYFSCCAMAISLFGVSVSELLFLCNNNDLVLKISLVDRVQDHRICLQIIIIAKLHYWGRIGLVICI